MNKKTKTNPKGAGAKAQMDGGKRRNLYVDDQTWADLNELGYDSRSAAVREMTKEKKEENQK